jgi:replicative DNA helicase
MIAPLKEKKLRSRPASSTEIPGSVLYSQEAERAVLGSMMARPDVVIDQVTEKLRRDDFFVPAHQELFDTFVAMRDALIPVDITTTHQYLIDGKLADVVGSPGILAELINGFASHLNVGSYINIVREKSILRQLQETCSTIVQDIADHTDSVVEVLDRAEGGIFAIADQAMTQSTVRARDEIEKAIQLIESFQKKKGKLIGIPTGFAKLNALTTGWQNGDMVVLAARPGVGKTALALTFARHAMNARYDEERDDWVKPGYGVGIFSLEMTNAQLMLRLLSSYASESMQQVRQGTLDEQQLQKLKMIAEEMKTYPLFLDDSSYLTIHQLRAKARRMKDLYGIDLLIIDYLQLLHSESDQAKDSRQNEVAEISRGIKALAKELKIPIIVLAQLNRKSEEANAEPALHNLRESGAIEQDADVVMMLHREKVEEDAPPTPMMPYKLIIAKQRNGPTDKLDIIYHAPYTRFEDPIGGPRE